VQIDRRWSAGNVDDLRRYAAELVALAPDAILANGSAALTLFSSTAGGQGFFSGRWRDEFGLTKVRSTQAHSGL
jgi:hypothetical protein